MAGAFLFGYIEFKTPGLGVFGALAVVCALLFFFGHYVAGLSGQEFLVLLAVGVALLAVEIFILPGTILPGLLGLACLSFGLLLAMADIYPDQPVEVALPRFELPAIKLIASMMLAFLGAALVTRLLPATPFYQHLVADGDLNTPTPQEDISAKQHLEVGIAGTATTVIRPSGTVDFGDGPVDVVSQGEFIDRGSRVKIVDLDKSKVIVEEV
jgi:membrane-bound serine protease (ClpP class)